jgi:formylglycine-generating enzyme required for sulfatase activity
MRESEEGMTQTRSRIFGFLLIAGLLAGSILVSLDESLAGPLSSEQTSSQSGIRSEAKSVALSPEQERALRPLDSFKECADCPDLVVVPAGSFQMGSSNSEAFNFMVGGSGDAQETGRFQHKVTLGAPFAVGRLAITFSEWDACLADGGCAGYRPSDNGWGRHSRPVVNVSWADIQSYLSWLSHKTGRSYRLLSEVEFEYVARAGNEATYPWGAEVEVGSANCDGCGSLWQTNESSGHFIANAFGLFNVAQSPCGRDSNIRGAPCNVWEWVEDCDHGSQFGRANYNGAPANGAAWIELNCSRHVVRGGVWYYYPPFLRSSYRSSFSPDYRNYFLGFRVARSLAH